MLNAQACMLGIMTYFVPKVFFWGGEEVNLFVRYHGLIYVPFVGILYTDSPWNKNGFFYVTVVTGKQSLAVSRPDLREC